VNGSARIAAVTIVAWNYLALAGSLLSSIAERERDIDRRLLYWSSSGSRA
jgi:hypothetical protein